MAEKRTIIWSPQDRPCDLCAAAPARWDDWLCSSCREGLETDWLRLTEPSPRPLELPLVDVSAALAPPSA